MKIGLKAEHAAGINTLLLELNACYSEMGQKATTDFDEMRAHGNEIVNIWEAGGVRVFYQQDKDWFLPRRGAPLDHDERRRRLAPHRARRREDPAHLAARGLIAKRDRAARQGSKAHFVAPQRRSRPGRRHSSVRRFPAARGVASARHRHCAAVCSNEIDNERPPWPAAAGEEDCCARHPWRLP